MKPTIQNGLIGLFLEILVTVTTPWWVIALPSWLAMLTLTVLVLGFGSFGLWLMIAGNRHYH